MHKEVSKMDNTKFLIETKTMPHRILIIGLVCYIVFRKKGQTRITYTVVVIALLYYFIILWDRVIH
jgi:hypothetical protein